MPKKQPPSPQQIRTRAFQGVFIILLAVTVVFGTNVALFTYLQSNGRAPASGAAATGTDNTASTYSFEEIASHNTNDDCWIVVDNTAYDITPYISQGTHPGGQTSLETACGQDVSESFQNSHSDRALQSLKKYEVGEVATQ